MIREYKESDLETIKEIHRKSGLDYKLPDFSNPLILNKLIFEKNDTIIASVLHRACLETCLMVNPEAKAKDKWDAIQKLDVEMASRAYWLGFDEVHASVPAIGFDRRLRQVGWFPDREGWTLWSRGTDARSTEPSE